MSEWNFADVWEAIARAQPTAECLVQGGRRVSWAEFDRRAGSLARTFLDHGLERQAKVAQCLYSCAEYLESVLACFKASLVPVNTNFRYQPEELLQLWEDADVDAVVFHASLAERIEPIRQRLARVSCWLCVDDTGHGVPSWSLAYESAAGRDHPPAPAWPRSPDDLILLYTGGTTGRPKGVMWRQDDVFAIQNRTSDVRYPEDGGLDAVPGALAARRRSPTRLVPCAPLVHGTGAFSAFNVLNGGGTVILLTAPRFDPVELLDTVERERATQLAIVGDAFCRPVVAALDDHPGRWDLSSLGLVVSSGMVWSEPVKTDLLRHLPTLLCVDMLGASEAIGVAQARTRAGETGGGRFLIGPDTRVVNDDGGDVVPGSGRAGLLMLRGRMPLGYYKDQVATASTFRQIGGERWSAPGDFAIVELDGSVRLVGRGSLVVNTGGEKVFVEEVEAVLRQDPSVADAGVVGLPDRRLGQAVVAAVQPAPGRSPDVDSLTAAIRARLAGYKVPKRIVVMESVGRGPTGKLDYAWLRRALEAELARRQAITPSWRSWSSSSSQSDN